MKLILEYPKIYISVLQEYSTLDKLQDIFKGVTLVITVVD